MRSELVQPSLHFAFLRPSLSQVMEGTDSVGGHGAGLWIPREGNEQELLGSALGLPPESPLISARNPGRRGSP